MINYADIKSANRNISRCDENNVDVIVIEVVVAAVAVVPSVVVVIVVVDVRMSVAFNPVENCLFTECAVYCKFVCLHFMDN